MRQSNVFIVDPNGDVRLWVSFREDGGAAYVHEDKSTNPSIVDLLKTGIKSPKTGLVIPSKNGRAFLDILPFYINGQRMYASIPFDVPAE